MQYLVSLTLFRGHWWWHWFEHHCAAIPFSSSRVCEEPNPSCFQCSHHYFGDHLHHALVPLERSLSGQIPSPSQHSWLNQIVGTAPLVHSQPWIITCYWHKGGQAKWSRKKKRRDEIGKPISTRHPEAPTPIW